MNIRGLKLVTCEYTEGSPYVDMKFKNKECAIRLASTDIDNALLLCTQPTDTNFVLDISVENNDHKYTRKSQKYCWALIQKLANAMRLDKNEAYIEMLDRYGQSEFVVVEPKVNVTKYYTYNKKVAEKEINGKLVYYYKLYKGMHDMTQDELNILIEGVKKECNELGIDTSTPSEVDLYG